MGGENGRVRPLKMDQRRGLRPKDNVVDLADQNGMGVEGNNVGYAAIERRQRIGKDRRPRRTRDPVAVDKAVGIFRRPLRRKMIRQNLLVFRQQVYRHATALLDNPVGVALHIDGGEYARRRQRQRAYCRSRQATAAALMDARDDGDAATSGGADGAWRRDVIADGDARSAEVMITSRTRGCAGAVRLQLST